MNRFSDLARTNRRGCLAIVLIVILVLACLAYIGFRADPISDWESAIPTLGRRT